jgi:uncharacterized SAM-binding protein YcdF (DUF218 family)
MSVPAGAWVIGRAVSAGYTPIEDAFSAKGIQAIVVLDGNTAIYARGEDELAVVGSSSAVRALEVIRLYRLLQPELVVITAGTYRPAGRTPEGAAIRQILIGAGIPAERVLLDSASRSTREHAKNVTELLREKRVLRFALVTSAVHMRRAMRAFSDAGASPVPAPAPLESPEELLWWPNLSALYRSVEAWHEVFGTLYYFVVPPKPGE